MAYLNLTKHNRALDVWWMLIFAAGDNGLKPILAAEVSSTDVWYSVTICA